MERKDTSSSSLSIQDNGIVNSKSGIVKLNIGGYLYTTTKQTLMRGENNFFSGLLNGKFDWVEIDGAIFIDRDGKYFEPILEYLRTGDVVIPEGMVVSSVLREAEFFGIKFPLSESSTYLTYITDDWLTRRKGEQQYNAISKLADSILAEVLWEFKSCAYKAQQIQSHIYLREILDEDTTEFAQTLARMARKQHETQDIKTAVQSEVQKSYREWTDTVLNQQYFDCLADQTNRDTLIAYCKRQNNLTVAILPKTIKINWKGTSKDWIAGYYFVHALTSTNPLALAHS